jgi:spore maturation protein CgeB
MRILIFGLTISSSWGNGHATLWRALCRALAQRGHSIAFFERDVPYYAAHRDLTELEKGELVLYGDWVDVETRARDDLARADVAIVTSYCMDAVPATDLMRRACDCARVFYDLDTPVTLEQLGRGASVPYLPPDGLRAFDLVLSYTGGRALDELRARLGAAITAPLYGSVDPATHRPAQANPAFEADLSYLGTYAADRQHALDRLFLDPARQLPDKRFVIGGAQYPADFPWLPNLYFVRHLPPVDHPAFFASSPLTLNVTRRSMRAMGYCPSGRLFEAAACGATIVTDVWGGLEHFFTPGVEILIANDAADVIAAMRRAPDELRAMGHAARQRALIDHTSDQRAQELEGLLEHAITLREAA